LLLQFDIDISTVAHRDACEAVVGGEDDAFGTETHVDDSIRHVLLIAVVP